ncbi:MAG: hypothetical protein OSA11_00190 [Candidatus Nanopelagicales bacterium]|nr:hypothetical protein [Candidatus Nanopelagicales bacterium]
MTFSGGVFVLIGPEFNISLVGPVSLSFALSFLAVALAVKIISENPPTFISILLAQFSFVE